MPFNGSGLFTQIYNWVTDKNNAVLVTASRFQSTYDDMATALSNCMTRDGQSPPTADIPMGAKKLTGLAAGVAATDAANVGQVAALANAQIFYDAGNSGVALSIDWTNGQHQQFTLTNNATVTLGNGVLVGWHTLRRLQDATGGRTLAWGGAAYSANRWAGNQTAPVMSPVASSVELIMLFWDGSTWSQFRLGTNQRRSNYSMAAINTGTQSIGAGVTAKVLLDSATDPYSEWGVGTGLFTAKVAGLYRLDFNITFLLNASNNDIFVVPQIAGNANIFEQFFLNAQSGHIFSMSGSLTHNMAAGDTAFVEVTNFTAAGLTLQIGCAIQVTRIGDAQ